MLMTAITALLIVIGGMIDGRSGMMLALLFTLGMNFFSHWFSDKMVLRMYNAQEVDGTSAPRFYRIVQELAGRAGLLIPRVYLTDGTQSNALTAGRSPEHAAVAATTGIPNILSEHELRGMMVHELTYAQYRGILISAIPAIMADAISALTNFTVSFGGRDGEGRPANPIAEIVVAILAPLVASLVQVTVPRAHEFEAGHGDTTTNGDPQVLASVLDEIHRYVAGIPFVAAEAHPAIVRMMVMDPLHGGGPANLSNTHLATEERAARLTQMTQTG